MQQYRSQRATRWEFKAVKQWEIEDPRDYSRRVRQLADIAFPEKSLRERERDMRDQFIEGRFDSRIQLNLHGDERDCDFGETLQRARELEIIHKTHESKRERELDKVRYSHDEYEDSDLIRAGYSSNNQYEEKFAALQTSLTNVASRFDRFENSICQQISKQTDQMTKHLEQSSTKQVELMTRNPDTGYERHVICDHRCVRKFATAGWWAASELASSPFSRLLHSEFSCVVKEGRIVGSAKNLPPSSRRSRMF